MKTSLVVLSAFVLIGCERSHQGSSLTSEQAKTLAIRLANEKTDTIYHRQPFQDGQLPRFEAGHWLWTNRRGYGTGDIEARVEIAADGSTNSVIIQMYDSKNSMDR